MSTSLGTFPTSGNRPQSRQRPYRSPTLADLAAKERAARADERAHQIAAVERLERDLVSLHLAEFPAAAPVVAPDPQPVDVPELVQQRTREAVRGISWLSRTRRRDARQRATTMARAEAATETARRRDKHDEDQAVADANWADLLAHKPEAVLAALDAAFEDNQAPAACVDVGLDGEIRFVNVVILFPAASMVPELTPATTPGGKPTLRKRTKKDRNALYAAAMGSTVLATVKEGFAAAPSVDEIRVLVVRKEIAPSAPDERLGAIYAGRFPRHASTHLTWANVDPTRAILQAPDAELIRKGTAGEIVPFELSQDPALTELLGWLGSALPSQPS